MLEKSPLLGRPCNTLTGYNTKSYTLLSTFLCYNNTVLIPKLISYSRFRQENQGTEAGWREGHCVYEPQS